MATATFTVRGISPLLTHNPAGMAATNTAPTRGAKTYDQNDDAEAGTYRTPDGICAIPGIAFRSAMLRSATIFTVKRGKPTVKSQLGHVMAEELVPLTDHEGRPLMDYKIDVRRVMVQKNGVMRARPRFDEWQAVVRLEYDSVVTTHDVLLMALADAGARIGVGDYRPEKGGWFGRFEVIETA